MQRLLVISCVALTIGAISLEARSSTPIERTDPCGALSDSVVKAAARSADTATSLGHRLALRCRNDAASLLAAGSALRLAVPRLTDTSIMYNPTAGQAEALLSRAVQLEPRSASAWAEYGLLLDARSSRGAEAVAAITRALRLATKGDSSAIPRSLLSALHLARGRELQEELDRWRWLKDGSRLPVTTPTCFMAYGAFCENYDQPTEFNQALADAPSISGDLASRRQAVLAELDVALRVDASNVVAALRYDRELALGEEWDTLAASANRQQRGNADSALLLAVRGLALARIGQLEAADTLFQRAVAVLPESLRARFTQAPPHGDSAVTSWDSQRSLWVTGFNEALVEYRARLTYALLVLGNPETGVRGDETPQGDVLIRYGWPRMISQVQREMDKVMTPTQVREALDPQAQGARAGIYSVGSRGGRWVFWTYRMDEPSFAFEVGQYQRLARPIRESQADAFLTVAHNDRPFAFHSRVAPHRFQLQAQVVRFHASNPDTTLVAIYGIVPSALYGIPPREALATGLFVFADTAATPRWQRQGTFDAGPGLDLSYTLSLPAGDYRYRIEALAHAESVAATRVDSFTTANESVYGLKRGESGRGEYTVTLELLGRTRRSLPVRLLSRIGLAKGERTPRVALEWQNTRLLAPDGRAVDYVAIQLPEDIKGEYELAVTVAERGTNRRATARRAITVLGL